MKKILLALLAICLMSCAEKNNSGMDENTTIDKAILGKWKVEYSKTIKPAIYIRSEAELGENSDLKLGLNYPENALIREYFGNPLSESLSYMFSKEEDAIEITSDNVIKINWIERDGSLHYMKPDISYRIKDGHLLRGGYNSATSGYMPILYYQYSIAGDELTIEFVGAEPDYSVDARLYKISKYSRIAE